MTRAPRSASRRVQYGPAPAREQASAVTPARSGSAGMARPYDSTFVPPVRSIRLRRDGGGGDARGGDDEGDRRDLRGDGRARHPRGEARDPARAGAAGPGPTAPERQARDHGGRGAADRGVGARAARPDHRGRRGVSPRAPSNPRPGPAPPPPPSSSPRRAG